MNTEELIESLAREARPVQAFAPPGRLLLAFAAAAVGVAGAASFMLRADLARELRGPALLLETALLLLAAFAVAWGPAVLARPAAPRLRGMLALAGVAALGAAFAMALRQTWGIGPSWPAWSGVTLLCAAAATLFSLLPFAGGIALLKRGASVHPLRSGALLGFAAGALGAVAQTWVCDINAPAHVILGHAVLPGAALSALGAWAGHRWLRW
jgi:hypothetical protein